MQYTYQDDFSTAHKLLNMSILMPFSVSAVFSHLFHISKMFPFEYFFIQGNKRNCSEWGQVNREGGARGSWCFWSKPTQHSAQYGQVHHNSPIMKWANALSLQKKFTEAECSLSQQRQLVTDTDGLLEHSPSGGSLYYKGPSRT